MKGKEKSIVEFRIDEESRFALCGQTLTLFESTRLAQKHRTLNIIYNTPK
jgi:hypothetical protein